jgi:hypothetical protein
MRSSKPISYSTNPSLETSDDDKTKIFVSGLDAISREPVFMSKTFGVRSCWKFHHRCSLGPRVYPEIFAVFSHMVGEIFTNYLLIN